MRFWRLTIALAVSIGLAPAQSTRKVAPEFEVASVKPGPAPAIGRVPFMRGGPGTREPGRILYSGVSLMQLLAKAYGLYPDQIFGPSWLISETYTIAADVPPGVSKEQFEPMLQNLLVKRFQLALHREEKDLTVYALVVGNGGPKLRVSPAKRGTDDADEAGAGSEPVVPGRAALDDDGCPVVRPGSRGMIGGLGRNNCSTFRRYPISDLVKLLEMIVAMESGAYYGSQASQAHIVDRTGLRGEFDFTLKFAFNPHIEMAPGASMNGAADAPTGGNLFAALEKQLGLKLEKTKAKLGVLMIEHAVKVPTEN